MQQLTLAWLRLVQSQRDTRGPFLNEAHSILAELLPAVEARGWARYLIEVLMLQALVYQAQVNQTGALAAIERALALAEPEHYVRIFVVTRGGYTRAGWAALRLYRAGLAGHDRPRCLQRLLGQVYAAGRQRFAGDAGIPGRRERGAAAERGAIVAGYIGYRLSRGTSTVLSTATQSACAAVGCTAVTIDAGTRYIASLH